MAECVEAGMSAAEMISIFKDIVLAVAAGVTAYAAFTGIGRWKAELSWRASFDVARRLALATYALRNEVSYCRAPVVEGFEFPEEYWILADVDDPEKQGRAWAHVYTRRWEPVGRALQEFEAAALEAEALWGRQVRERSLELRGCIRSLRTNIDTFIRDQYSGGEYFKNGGLKEQVESAIWNYHGVENQLTKNIDSAITKIEEFVRPHLSRM